MPRKPIKTTKPNSRVFKLPRARVPKPTAALEKAVENERSASPPVRARKSTAKTLTDAQEKTLIKWIRRVKDLSALPNSTQIAASANQIFSAGGEDSTLSKACVDNFIKRLPVALTPSKKKAAKKKRLETSDLSLLKEWFARLEASIEGVSPANIYNFDETVFQIGEGNRPVYLWCFGGRPPPMPEQQQNRYCEWITTIECMSADGWVGEPYLVIQGESHLDEWFQVKGYSDEAVLNLSPSGRVTDNAAYDWVQEFHNQTKGRVEEGQKRVLMFRGEAQFLTFNFLDFCDKSSIIPFCFPSKMGHLMQPFDCKALEPFRESWKKWHRRNFTKAKDSPDEEKMLFIEQYPDARKECLSPEVIVDSFANQGISPFDPSKILTKLK